MRRLQLALCGGGGGGGGGVYIAQTLYLHSEWHGYPWQLALVVLFLVALAHILHVQIVTCTVMMVHGGGSGVMEVDI